MKWEYKATLLLVARVPLQLGESVLCQGRRCWFIANSDVEGYLPVTSPFLWSCKPWPSSMSSCVSHGAHYPMASMGSNIIPSAICTWSGGCPHPLHITLGLHPSFVDAPVDINSRSCNFPLIHPMEVLLARHWVTAHLLFSCGVFTSSLPMEVGLHGVGLVHLSHAWQTPIHKGTPTSDMMRRRQFWWRMCDHLHWSITL